MQDDPEEVCESDELAGMTLSFVRWCAVRRFPNLLVQIQGRQCDAEDRASKTGQIFDLAFVSHTAESKEFPPQEELGFCIVVEEVDSSFEFSLVRMEIHFSKVRFKRRSFATYSSPFYRYCRSPSFRFLYQPGTIRNY